MFFLNAKYSVGYCSVGAFKCVHNKTCISSYEKCNNVLDCADGSDEAPELCKSTKPQLRIFEHDFVLIIF